MFAASSKIGDGTFKIVNHRDGTRSVVKRSKAEIAKMDTKFTQRYQVFENNKDFFEQIVSDYDGEIEYKLDGKGALIELTIDGKKVTDTELSLYDEKTNSVIDKNGELIKDIPYTERKAQSKRAQDFIKNMMKIVVNGSSYDAMDIGMTIMSMQANMNAPIKRAANLEYASIQKGLKASDYRWEHMMPTNYVILNLIDYYTNNKNADADAMADKLFNKYNVAVIPKTMDKVLEETRLQQFMPADYTLDQPVWRRYYNFLTFGDPRIKAIVTLNPDGKKIEIGKAYEEAGKVINKKKRK